MGSFDRAVLVGDAAIVAAGLHAIMGAKRFIPICHVLRGIGIEIAECSRKAVRAVIARCAADRPKGVLQTTRQRGKTLAAFDNLGMLEAAIGQPEVIEQILEDHAGDRDLEARCVGKIRQPHASRLVNLPEHDLLIFAMARAPCADAALKCAANTRTEFGVALAKLTKNTNRPQAGSALQHGNNLFGEYPFQWIGPTSFVFGLLLAWRTGVCFDPITSGWAET